LKCVRLARMIFTFSLSYPYISIIRATFWAAWLISGSEPLLISAFRFGVHPKQGHKKQARKARGKMNGLHWIAQILLAGVFFYIGCSKLFGYRRANRFLPAGLGFGSLGLSSELAVAVGIVEIAGALALVVPIDLWPPDVLPRLAAAGLALVAMTAAVYHMRRHESAAPSITLFLLALFVIVARWPR